jgi:hypothetical protein
MTCDDYQIAFEQLEAGASAPIGRAELDAHVAGCAECAPYVAVSRKASQTMSASTTLAPVPPFELIADFVSHERHQLSLRGAGWASLFLVGMFTIDTLGGMPLDEAIAKSFTTLVVTVIGVVLWRRHRLRTLGRIERQGSAQLLELMKRELDQRIRAAKTVRWLSPLLLGMMYLLYAEPGALELHHVAYAVAMLAIAWIWTPIAGRRARRERELLGD